MSRPNARVVMQLVRVAVALLACCLPAAAQGISIPNTFVNGTAADADQVNANFAALAGNALNRTGGTMTGTLNVQAILPDGDNTRDLGSAALSFKNAWIDSVLTLAVGAAGTPSLAIGNATTGLYANVVGGVDLVSNGIQAFSVNATQMINSPTQPRAVAWANNVAQSIATSTLTAVQFNAEDVDVGTMHDNATNNSRITVPGGGGGFYLIFCTVEFANGAGNYRDVFIRKNGATTLNGATRVGPTASTTNIETIQGAVLAAADYVECVATQDSGGNLNISDTATRSGTSNFGVVKVW